LVSPHLFVGNQGDLPDATDSLQKSLSIYRELGERNRVALVQNRLAIALLWQGKTSEAAPIIESSLSTARELGEANVVAEMYENQAYIQMEEHPEKAASSALAAMDRHKANGDTHGVAMDSAILAQALLAEGKINDGRTWLNKAFQILGPNPGGELGVQMLTVKGQLDAREGRRIAARNDLEHAAMQAKKLGADSMGMQARLALVELELQSKDKAADDRADALWRDATRRGFGPIAEKVKTLQASARAANLMP
jgi:tetratricopeptide (TPR) repeat protein